MEYVIALALGVGGWTVTHLFATWRQSAANQSEWRWKLLTCYADFLSSCGTAADRNHQLRLYERDAMKHAPDAVPPDLQLRIDQTGENWYQAQARVQSAKVLLDLLEPAGRYLWEPMFSALQRYCSEAGDFQAKEALKEFQRERDKLVREQHKNLVRMWKPAGAIDMIKYQIQVWRHRYRQWRKRLKGGDEAKG